MRRIILVPLLIVLAVFAIVGGVGYYLYNNYLYYQTDDAQVTGKILSISAPASGQLTTLRVKVGDRVTEGQAIATVTPAAPAGANGGNATPNAITLNSPINGTIVQIPTVEGQTLAAGTAIAQVTDLTSLTVTSYIDEGAIDNVKAGQQVDVTVDAYNGTTFSGHVQQIVQATAGQFSLLPTQDPSSGNFTKVGQRVPVIITLDGNAGKDILPGMSAETTIHIH